MTTEGHHGTNCHVFSATGWRHHRRLSFGQAAWTSNNRLVLIFFHFFKIKKTTPVVTCTYAAPTIHGFSPLKFCLKKKTARVPVSVSPLEGPPAFHQITAARLNILYLIKDSSSRAIQTEKSTRVMKRAKKTPQKTHGLTKKAAHLCGSWSAFAHLATAACEEG